MFEQIALANEKERKSVFDEAASVCKMSAAVIEKDFWVCYCLDKIFSAPELCKILRFKGGTSLSKVYGIIERFSEDIDLILDWNSLPRSAELLKNFSNTEISNTQKDKINKFVNEEAGEFISAELKSRMQSALGETVKIQCDADPNVLKIAYPKAVNDKYLLPYIKLEIGPLAAWIPNGKGFLKPYLERVQGINLHSVVVPTISAERSFWEKATILHCEHFRNEKHSMPERYSRHYYDLYMFTKTKYKELALEKIELLRDVVEFKKQFYPRTWAHYELAQPKTISLMPSDYCAKFLEIDYKAMQMMIFGEIPSWAEILSSLAELEREIRSR